MLSAKLKEAAGNSADATLYVNDVFSTWLYTGNGSTQTITNGIDLAGKGGLVWVKSRSAATNNFLFDTPRGVNVEINSNTTDANATLANSVTAFNSSGFALGSAAGINVSAATYASWTFREAAKFFDVVTYTGTGSARTIAHSLGVAPGMIIVKRTDTTGNWQVYHRSLTSAAYSIQLNLTDAQASAPTVWNSTAPTSSVFSVGTDATVNASGGTYVAYLYAHDTSSTGFIQCGSYTGTASPVSVTLGWEPQFVLVKRANGIQDWGIMDTMRGYTTNFLRANSANAEDAGNSNGTPTATGFIADGNWVQNTGTYIYMAIRMPNKPPTTGTQVYNTGTRTGSASIANSNSNITTDLAVTKRYDNSAEYWAWSNRLTDITTLQSNSTSAELVGAVSAWDTMVGVKYAASNGATNAGNLIDLSFKRAPGFFDVVCYTGTGVATTQAHNLTVVPELMIVKERSAINNWWVYDAIDGNTKYSVLNSTAIPVTSSTAWNNTTPTASVFSIGTATNVNASAQTFVAYLFATLAGISKVGSYTGNGSADGPFVFTGFRPAYVMIKCSNGTYNWIVFDNKRSGFNVNNDQLYPNLSAAEDAGGSGAQFIDLLSNGFKLRNTAADKNAIGGTYIGMAFAEAPQKFSLAR